MTTNHRTVNAPHAVWILVVVVVLALAISPRAAAAADAPAYMPGTPLPIPASATVLTLSGLNYNLYNDMPSKFQGVFSRAPYTMYKVNYPASLASNSITTGVANLDAALHAHPGPKIVLAQSQGAQVSSRWMREHADDPAAPGADELTFILTGNPLRSNGGGAIIGGIEVGGTTGQPTPTTTKWPIIDVARRYDGWADAPNDRTNQHAVDNAEVGKSVMHKGYGEVDITASTHTISTSGNTTYVLTKEDKLPMWDERTDIPDAVMRAMQRHIETAYNRPDDDPTIVVPVITSSSWKSFLGGLGVDATPTFPPPPSPASPPPPATVTPPRKVAGATTAVTTPTPKPPVTTNPSVDVVAPTVTRTVLLTKIDTFLRALAGNVRVSSDEAGMLTAKLVVTIRIPASRRGAAPRLIKLTVGQRTFVSVRSGATVVRLTSTKAQSAAIKRVLRVGGARVLRTDLSGVITDAAKNRDPFTLRVG